MLYRNRNIVDITDPLLQTKNNSAAQKEYVHYRKKMVASDAIIQSDEERDDILVAPVVTEHDERIIVLPSGDWYFQNKKWKGGKAIQ